MTIEPRLRASRAWWNAFGRRASTTVALVAAAVVPDSLAGQTVVTGTAVDSVAGGAPLVGAVVQLVLQASPGQARIATTDPAGRFRLESVPAGQYLIGFLHPRLDELVLTPPVRVVSVTGAALQVVDIGIPGPRSIAAAVCGEASADSVGLLMGRVLDADTGTPVSTGRVTVSWPEIVVEAGGVRQEPQTVDAMVDPEGLFALCGVPTDLPVVARATAAGGVGSGDVELQLTPAGFLYRDLRVTPATTSSSVPAPGVEPSTSRRGSARVIGRVSVTGGTAKARAQVLLHGSGAFDTTGADGTFALDSLPAGTHTLEVRAIGYAPRRLPVDLASGRSTSIDVALDERLPTLDAVTIFGRAGGRSDAVGFMERSRMGIGHFFSAADIDRLAPYSVADLLRRVPGVQVFPSGSGFGSAIRIRGSASMSVQGEKPCLPAVFLDGISVTLPLEGMVAPREIAGIEVYNGPATVPSAYLRGDCGSIVIWTKGQPD